MSALQDPDTLKYSKEHTWLREEGDGTACVQAGSVLPVDPIQHAAMRIQRQQSHGAEAVQGGRK